MDDLGFDILLDREIHRIHHAQRNKPAKRMWREIEAIQDKRQLERELLDMDVCLALDDLQL